MRNRVFDDIGYKHAVNLNEIYWQIFQIRRREYLCGERPEPSSPLNHKDDRPAINQADWVTARRKAMQNPALTGLPSRGAFDR